MRALAPAYGKTRTKCQRERNPELLADFFRQHQDQPGPRPSPIQIARNFIDRRDALIRGGEEIHNPRFRCHAGPRALTHDAGRHDEH